MTEEQLIEFLKNRLRIQIKIQTNRLTNDISWSEVSLHLISNEDDELNSDNIICYSID